MAARPPACPVCQNCSILVESAVGDAKKSSDAIEAELKKCKKDSEQSLETIAFLKKQLLSKTNEAAKAKKEGAKLAAELKQLKVDLNKLIGMWEPPPSTGEHIVLTLGDDKKEEE